MSRVVESLVARLNAKRCGSGWLAKCPAHDDQKPSLSIGEGAAGCVLLKCHAGCQTNDVIAAIGLTVRDLFAESSLSCRNLAKSFSGEPKSANAQSADEFLSAQDCRRAIDMAMALRERPGLCERVARARGWKPETIRNLTLEPSLGWHDEKLAFIYETGVKLRWRQRGERIVRWAFGKPWLWRGSFIDIAQTIVLTEGETDAISLIDAGLEFNGRTLSVALPSSSTFDEKWAKLFAGKELILAFDADRAGQEATLRVSRFLRPHVASLRQLHWAGLSHAS